MTAWKMTVTLGLVFCLLLCSCGAVERTGEPAAVSEDSPDAAADVMISPEPTPKPFVEPELKQGCALTFDGVEQQDGVLLHDGVRYMKLTKALAASGIKVRREGSVFCFPWRKSEVVIDAGSELLNYREEPYRMQAPALVCQGGEELLVPIESFCDGIQIGVLYDEEYDHLYCTPAAGNWEIPQGYTVPVMMYHGVGYGSEDANLFVNPWDMEAQIVYLLDNGYTPIWFEDLEHVEDYEKPVILTFDDGWKNNYDNLLPLVVKYQVKVTTFAVGRFFEHSGNHLDEDEALEMYNSGLVSFQSHTMTHTDLTWLTPEQQEQELAESRLFLTRMFGKEPFVLSYPIGGCSLQIRELAGRYYRFGVKMYSSEPYNTSDDPMLVYRFFPEKHTPMWQYIAWLEKSFPS